MEFQTHAAVNKLNSQLMKKAGNYALHTSQTAFEKDIISLYTVKLCLDLLISKVSAKKKIPEMQTLV